MATQRFDLARAVVRPLMARSRFRLGGLDARGLPAILVGVAAIVVANGACSAFRRATTALPESLREARLLWLAVRPLGSEIATTRPR